MKKFLLFLFIILTISNNGKTFTNIPQNKVLLRALNKQTGRTKDIEIPVHDQTIFENILIKVNACYTRPEDETPENSAFLEITEVNTNYKEELSSVKKGTLIFSGWMFSSSPSLSAMEHANYDIWVLECKNDPTLPQIEIKETIQTTKEITDAI